MAQDWIMRIWGVRGSMPTPLQDVMEYGGNTACISVDCGEDLVVFDAGTGLVNLGRSLTGKRPVHLLFSHVHLDHLLGLFVFPPFHDPNAEIHLYGESRNGVPFRQQLEALVGPPYWPVGFADFPARITFHEIGPDQQFALPGGRTVRTMRGNHPNLGLIYRLEDGQRSVVYTLDCELTAELRPRLTAFCRNADVLVWDANFTSADLARHPGWGHSSWEQGVELRRDAGAGLVIMTHYNQSYTDAFLREQELSAQGPGVRFAREAMEVRL
ncbi:MAG: MBL fold metallo-hydrolase [Oscillospiraceae bacterium]|nr:MBL fold metallo-hydrolase [Oscillospiraceae bacterium]